MSPIFHKWYLSSVVIELGTGRLAEEVHLRKCLRAAHNQEGHSPHCCAEQFYFLEHLQNEELGPISHLAHPPHP